MIRNARWVGRQSRAEAGVTLVEAAFALPIFFLLLLGLVDLGFGVFQTSQATSAARDGARVAILDYKTAGTAGSADYNRIKAAVDARLAGRQVDELKITCQRSNGTTVSCGTSDLNDQPARVQVEVKWTYKPLSFVGAATGDKTIKGSATMRIVGRPISI